MKNSIANDIVYSTGISNNIRSEWDFWQRTKERGNTVDKAKAFNRFVSACENENKFYSSIDEILFRESY